MTPKQLDAIDALVAECVMGWEACDRDAKGWGKGPRVWITHDEENPTYQGFEPTVSWDCAGKVVERMRLSLLAITGTDGSPLWQARRWVSTQDDCSTNHEDPRVAVCMAALRAVGAGDRLDAAIKENA